MTLTTLTTSARAALTARLADLQTQRTQALAESAPPTGPGDAADRTGNIEALVRLSDIETRIAALELQLQAPDTASPPGAVRDSVEVGDRVVVRFGPGEQPERFLIGFVEQAGPDLPVITPASPLGQALLGAHPGDAVSYRAASGASITATLVDIAA